jgi:hypothetical protein
LRDAGLVSCFIFLKSLKFMTAKSTISQIFARASPEDLIAFLKKAILTDDVLKGKFVAEFAGRIRVPGEKDYVAIIGELRRDFSDRGFIHYNQSFSFAKGLDNLLAQADMHIEHGLYREAFDIALAVAREGAATYGQADDSSGSMAQSIDMAFETIQSVLSHEDVPYELRIHILDALMADFERKDYDDYGFEDRPWIAATSAQWEPDQVNDIEQALLRIQAGYLRKKSGYLHSSIPECLHALYQNHGLDDKRKKIEAESGISNVIRLRMVKALVEQGAYARAKTLVQEGIQDKRHRYNDPGELDWEDWLIKILELEGDTETLYRTYKKLYCDAGQHSAKWYQKWKAAAGDKWNAEFVELIAKISPGRDDSPAWLAAVLHEEEMWRKLISLLQHYSSDSSLITGYCNSLREHYPAEIIELIIPVIREEAVSANKRSHYRRICDYIIWIQKTHGGEEPASELIEELKDRYPYRTAMQDELGKVER